MRNLFVIILLFLFAGAGMAQTRSKAKPKPRQSTTQRVAILQNEQKIKELIEYMESHTWAGTVEGDYTEIRCKGETYVGKPALELYCGSNMYIAYEFSGNAKTISFKSYDFTSQRRMGILFCIEVNVDKTTNVMKWRMITSQTADQRNAPKTEWRTFHPTTD